MNRDELTELVSTTWRFGLISRSVDDLVNKLWPVLAEVYEEGLMAAMNWTIANKGGIGPTNPYKEV